MIIIMSNIKIRKGVWETNSSSTHALVIKKEEPKELPEELYFDMGEFGWEQSWNSDAETKGSYLHTAIYQRFYDYENDKQKYYEYRNKITDILSNYHIKANWLDVETIEPNSWYYIDHCDELEDFIELIINHPSLLIDWLFNEQSLLVTDNDNSEMEYFEEAAQKYEDKEDYIFYGKYN